MIGAACARLWGFDIALGVWNNNSYVQHVDRDGNLAVVDSKTVQQMIAAGELLDVAPSAANPGHLALYFHQGRVTSAGARPALAPLMERLSAPRSTARA